MKNVNKLAVVFSLAALLAPALKAKSPEETYLQTCRKDAGLPVPVAVVSPSVPADYIGLTVEVEFTVDAKGKTSGFKVKSTSDLTLVGAVLDAVKKWEFKPAVSGGVPVTTKVVLPLHIVEGPVVGSRFAAN
jgi:TonB family protein